MKLYLFSLFIISLFFVPVYAQDVGNDIFIFTQNILRDSQGNLVTSFQVTKIGYLELASLNSFLDAESSPRDPIITIGGQKMQVMERQIEIDIKFPDVISDTTLNTIKDNGQQISLVRLIHDGLSVTAGDKLVQIWTFIRPVS